jgi:tetratricopeptide (TPR) repeat protein
MNQCPKCGREFPESFRFCPEDGTAFDSNEESSLFPPEPETAQEDVFEAEMDLGKDPDPDAPLLEPELEHDPVRYSDAAPRSEPAQISLRTLMLGIGILVMIAALAFMSVFLYLYLKPRYGSLVLKTTPPDAIIYVDGEQRGVSPLTLDNLRSGGHEIKVSKEGHHELVQNVQVMPYATENLHWELEPIEPQLSNEQLAEIESLTKKLEQAQREEILLPPPEDYNVLFFADSILAIDPANLVASEAKDAIAERMQRSADVAYARENWVEAEKYYKNLALIFPEDLSIDERLQDIGAKIEQDIANRQRQIDDWKTKADAALKAGTLLPPAKGNALEALRSIQRLDRRNVYARNSMQQLLKMLQNRGDRKISSQEWSSARGEFRRLLQYFPNDSYSKTRLGLVETKLAEIERAERVQAEQEAVEEMSQRRVENLRSSAIEAYRTGSYERSITGWREYLKSEPNSSEAYFYLGAAYLEQGQLDTAILNFERCLSIDSENALAHLNVGILYDRHRKDFERAVVHYSKVRDLGGVDKYDPNRLDGMIRELQDRIQLDQLQATAFPVEHKHVFSSCRGNLYFTDEGVEYKTTETDHSFYEAYNRLRSFAVEGNEVSIRTGRNKKFNFRLLRAGDGARVRQLVSRYLSVSPR